MNDCESCSCIYECFSICVEEIQALIVNSFICPDCENDPLYKLDREELLYLRKKLSTLKNYINFLIKKDPKFST